MATQAVHCKVVRVARIANDLRANCCITESGTKSTKLKQGDTRPVAVFAKAKLHPPPRRSRGFLGARMSAVLSSCSTHRNLCLARMSHVDVNLIAGSGTSRRARKHCATSRPQNDQSQSILRDGLPKRLQSLFCL